MDTPNQEMRAGREALADLVAPYRPLHVRYAADELISRAGTFAAGLQWIVQGLVLETESLAGRDGAPPDLLVSGDALGIELLTADAEERHQTTCRALTEVSLLFLDRASLDQALGGDSEFSRFLVGHLAARYARLRRARARLQLAPGLRLRATLLDLSIVCEPSGDGGALALPEAIDARVLGELSDLSPAQLRRLLPDVTRSDGASSAGVFHPDELLTALDGSSAPRGQRVS